MSKHRFSDQGFGAFLERAIFGARIPLLVVFAIITLDKLKIDDPVGAISVHGVVGLLGLLLVPVTNDGSSFSGQLIGAATIFGWVDKFYRGLRWLRLGSSR